MELVEYDRTTAFNLQIRSFQRGRHLIFDAVYEPDVPEAKKIHVYNFTCEKPRFVLIFLHGIGNGHVPYLMWFGQKFAEHGVETLFLIHPYHLQRGKPEWAGGEPFFHHSPAHCAIRFHQAVKDVRRTLDLTELEERYVGLPKLIMGFSFGGMIATMALALDKRLAAGILAFTGGDWRWINWYSPYVEPVREAYRKYGNEWGCSNEQRCTELRAESRKAVANLKRVEEIFSLTPSCFHYDPISYAKFVDQPVLFFKGVFDTVIPRKASESLLRLLPNARKILVPSGHKSSYVFRRKVLRESLSFIDHIALPHANGRQIGTPENF